MKKLTLDTIKKQTDEAIQIHFSTCLPGYSNLDLVGRSVALQQHNLVEYGWEYSIEGCHSHRGEELHNQGQPLTVLYRGLLQQLYIWKYILYTK